MVMNLTGCLSQSRVVVEGKGGGSPLQSESGEGTRGLRGRERNTVSKSFSPKAKTALFDPKKIKSYCGGTFYPRKPKFRPGRGGLRNSRLHPVKLNKNILSSPTLHHKPLNCCIPLL